MDGFWAYNKLTSDIKDLRQIYDFTYHLYLQEHEIIKEKLSKKKGKKVITITTPVGAVNHSLNALFYYTKDTYPNILRQLVLINLITVLEVYFTNVVREIAKRDLTPFKPDNEKADYMRNHLLNFSTLKGVENDLIEKDIRKLTSGGLEESHKFFLKRFDIDFKNIGTVYSEIEEIHERRHLFVHRNGICDALYARTYPLFGFKPGDRIILDHPYIISALDKILGFAHNINQRCLTKYPVNTRKILSVKGSRQFKEGDVKLLIEFEALKNSFDINIEILEQRVGKTTNQISDFTMQHIIFEKRFNLYVSAPKKNLAILMRTVKQNENILILNVTEIDF